MPAARPAAALAERLGAAVAADPMLHGQLDGRPVSFPVDRHLSPVSMRSLRAHDRVGWARWVLADLSLDIGDEAAVELLESIGRQVWTPNTPRLAVTFADELLDASLYALRSERHLATLAAGRWASWAAAVAPDRRWTAATARTFAEAAVAAAEAAA